MLKDRRRSQGVLRPGFALRVRELQSQPMHQPICQERQEATDDTADNPRRQPRSRYPHAEVSGKVKEMDWLAIPKRVDRPLRGRL